MEDATHLLFYDAIVIQIQPITYLIYFIERKKHFETRFILLVKIVYFQQIEEVKCMHNVLCVDIVWTLPCSWFK